MKNYTLSEPIGGDQSQGWALLSVCWAFVLCAALTTISRVWVRARLTKNLGWDDYTIMFTLFTTFLGAGLITAAVTKGGLGRHSYYLTDQERMNFVAIGWGDWIQTFITLALMKVSICLFLLRIVDATSFKYALYGLIAFLTLFTLAFVCLFLGICTPLRAWWEMDVEGARCLSVESFKDVVIVQGALSVTTDLMLAAFPMIFLWRLQVNLRTKLALCTLMGLGLITAACALVRTVLSGALTSPDETWDIAMNVGWRLPEVNIGIVCANAPALRPMYLYFCGRLDTQKRGMSVAVSDVVGSRARGGSAWGGGRDPGLEQAGFKVKSTGSLGSGTGSGREKLVGTYAQFEGRTRDEEMEMGVSPPVSPATRTTAWR